MSGTMRDTVLEHAKQVREKLLSTSDGLKLLELKDTSDNYNSGNLYLVALEIINRLQEEKRS